jgi:hypothetical protein
MKIVLMVGISFFTIGISSWAQQKALSKPSVAVLLTRLQSQSDVERSEAFGSSRQGCESCEMKVLVPPIACSRADSMSDACEGNGARSARM